MNTFITIGLGACIFALIILILLALVIVSNDIKDNQ